MSPASLKQKQTRNKKKECLKQQVQALIYYFEVLHVQIFIQQNIMGAMIFLFFYYRNAGGGWQLFSKTLVGKELHIKILFLTPTLLNASVPF